MRFEIKEGSKVSLFSIYTDNGRILTNLEVLDILNKLNEENERLTNIFKDVAVQLNKDEEYCEVTVAVPCKYYDDLRKLLIGDDDNLRFKEIVSTQKIVDTKTDKVYDGLVDDELLDEINLLDKQYRILKEELQRE